LQGFHPGRACLRRQPGGSPGTLKAAGRVNLPERKFYLELIYIDFKQGNHYLKSLIKQRPAMKQKLTGTLLAYALIIGSVWGLGEVALGVGLRSCAQLVSGSLMTGVALFFISAAWVASSRNYLLPILVVLVASIFKLFDAVLLSLPVQHGAIGNPIFAFWMEGIAFIALIALFHGKDWKKTSSRAMLGAGSALIAVALFPLVKYATGIPACVHPGTTVPLAIWFAPVAVAFSAVTVPLGFIAGDRIRIFTDRLSLQIRSSFVKGMASPATLVLCLLLVAIFRMIVNTNF
jgi:hypothetical protein